MVNIDYPRRSATLWILQVTKAQLHRGSAKGYLYVRTLISILKNQLKEKPPPLETHKKSSVQTPSKPVVTVRYILVVPKNEPTNWQWQFPAGWDESRRLNDHWAGLLPRNCSRSTTHGRIWIMFGDVIHSLCVTPRIYSSYHSYFFTPLLPCSAHILFLLYSLLIYLVAY